MVFSASSSAVGLVSREAYTNHCDTPLENAQNEILSAVAKRTPVDQAKSELQRSVGFALAFASLCSKIVISYPFQVMICQCHLSNRNYTASQILHILYERASHHGFFSLWSGLFSHIFRDCLAFIPQMFLAPQTFVEKENHSDNTLSRRANPDHFWKRSLKFFLSQSILFPFDVATEVMFLNSPNNQNRAFFSSLSRNLLHNRHLTATKPTTPTRNFLLSYVQLALPYFSTRFVLASVDNLIDLRISEGVDRFFSNSKIPRSKIEANKPPPAPTSDTNISSLMISNLDNGLMNNNNNNNNNNTNNTNDTSNDNSQSPSQNYAYDQSNDIDNDPHNPAAGDNGNGNKRKKSDNENDEDTPYLMAYIPDLIAGQLNEMIFDIVSFPLQKILFRLMVQGTRSLVNLSMSGESIPVEESSYTHMFNCFLDIYSTQGLGGFYVGISAAVLKHFFTISLLYATYITYKQTALVFNEVSPKSN